MNQKQPMPTLTFVGTEITYLEQLIDETPTKNGKHLLKLLDMVRQKRAAEQRQYQEQLRFAEQEAQKAFRRNNRKSAVRPKKLTEQKASETAVG